VFRAKREIPRINNLSRFRKIMPLTSCAGDGRTRCGPALPDPGATRKTTVLEWDRAHLAFYLEVADEFAQWFKNEAETAKKERRNINLVALLAGSKRSRLREISLRGHQGRIFAGLTSKQKYLLDRLEDLAATGRKTILYAKWPGLLELLGRHLEVRGVRSVLLHGGRDIGERTRDLDDHFRFGDAPVLLASLGVTQTGLNIYQASRVIFAERDWSSKTEAQASARVLRPQQKKDVEIEFVHLEGGIDEYQAQLVEMKADAAQAGIDWGTPDRSEADFLHLDSILGRFCEDFAADWLQEGGFAEGAGGGRGRKNLMAYKRILGSEPRSPSATGWPSSIGKGSRRPSSRRSSVQTWTVRVNRSDTTCTAWCIGLGNTPWENLRCAAPYPRFWKNRLGAQKSGTCFLYKYLAGSV
jgi:hypothetical protein